MQVMRAIAAQKESWGLQMLYNNPEFKPFIEDRMTEFTKEGKVKTSIYTLPYHNGF